jgi:hypothetical protein
MNTYIEARVSSSRDEGKKFVQALPVTCDLSTEALNKRRLRTETYTPTWSLQSFLFLTQFTSSA